MTKRKKEVSIEKDIDFLKMYLGGSLAVTGTAILKIGMRSTIGLWAILSFAIFITGYFHEEVQNSIQTLDDF